MVNKGAAILAAAGMAALVPTTLCAQAQVLTKEYDNGGVYEIPGIGRIHLGASTPLDRDVHERFARATAMGVGPSSIR